MPLQRLITLVGIALIFSGTHSRGRSQEKSHEVIAGKAAFSDFSQQKPGIFRKITVQDLPEPFATRAADNGPSLVRRPDNAWPQALPGFKVELYASNLKHPRLIRTAPNGDLFLAESRPGVVKVFRS